MPRYRFFLRLFAAIFFLLVFIIPSVIISFPLKLEAQNQNSRDAAEDAITGDLRDHAIAQFTTGRIEDPPPGSDSSGGTTTDTSELDDDDLPGLDDDDDDGSAGENDSKDDGSTDESTEGDKKDSDTSVSSAATSTASAPRGSDIERWTPCGGCNYMRPGTIDFALDNDAVFDLFDDSNERGLREVRD